MEWCSFCGNYSPIEGSKCIFCNHAVAVGIKCLNCGKPMKQVKDSITKTFTGYNWHCECMPKDMVVSFA